MAKLSKTSQIGALLAILLGATILLAIDVTAADAAEVSAISTTMIDYERVSVHWVTEEPAASAFVYDPTNEYGLLWFDSSPKTEHRVDLAGLECESEFHFNVISVGTTNQITNSGNMTFQTGPCPIEQGAIAPLQVVANAHTAAVSWGSLTSGQGTVRYGPSSDYGDTTTEVATSTRFHHVELTDLDCDATYVFEALTMNASGTIESVGSLEFGTYACDPFVDNVSIDSGSTTTTLTWTTDGPATGSVIIGESTDYGRELQTETQANTHRVDIGELVCGTSYHYRIIATNEVGDAFWTPDTTLSTVACTTTQTAGAPGQSDASHAPQIDNVVAIAGETTILVSWITDEVSSTTARYAVNGGDDSGSPIGHLNLTVIGDGVGVLHEVVLAELNCGTSYEIAAQSTDGSGLTSSSDTVMANTLACGSEVEVELTHPPLSPSPVDSPSELSIANVSVRDLSETTATIFWYTTSPATGSVLFGEPTGSEAEVRSPVPGRTQRIVLVGLQCGTTYAYSPVAHASNDATVVSGGVGNFVTLPCAAVSIDSINITAGRFSLEVSWATNSATDSLIVFGTDLDYGSVSFDPEPVTDHVLVIPNLECGTTYNLRVIGSPNAPIPRFAPNILKNTLECLDDPGAPPPIDLPPVDPPVLDPPVIDPPLIDPPPIDEPPLIPPTNGPPIDGLPDLDGPIVDPPIALTDIEVDASDSAAHISWLTDRATRSLVTYGTTTLYGLDINNQTSSFQHVADLPDLECASTYHYEVTAIPASGDSVTSGDLLFTTGPCVAGPFAITNQRVEAAMFSATITWTTTEDAAGRVDFGTNGDLATSVENPELLPGQTFVLSGLSCGTQYSYRVEASRPDAFANSRVLSFVTEACTTI